MKNLVFVGLLTLMLCGTAEAAVTDWPGGGQVSRVGQCIVVGGGKILTSLLTHLGVWGTETLTTVGQCALDTTNEVVDVAGDVVTLSVPNPDPVTTEEVHVETPQ